MLMYRQSCRNKTSCPNHSLCNVKLVVADEEISLILNLSVFIKLSNQKGIVDSVPLCWHEPAQSSQRFSGGKSSHCASDPLFCICLMSDFPEKASKESHQHIKFKQITTLALVYWL